MTLATLRTARPRIAALALISSIGFLAACSAGTTGQEDPAEIDAPAASSTEAPGGTSPAPSTAVGNDSSYKMIVFVKNDSTTQALTLQGTPRVDNNATLEPGYPGIIAAGTTGSYVATNKGNGIQMWLNFTATNGATISLDNDIPKVNENSYSFQVNGSDLTFKADGTGINGGDKTSSTAVIVDCSGEDCNNGPYDQGITGT